jgi:hypothetical protein
MIIYLLFLTLLKFNDNDLKLKLVNVRGSSSYNLFTLKLKLINESKRDLKVTPNLGRGVAVSWEIKTLSGQTLNLDKYQVEYISLGKDDLVTLHPGKSLADTDFWHDYIKDVPGPIQVVLKCIYQPSLRGDAYNVRDIATTSTPSNRLVLQLQHGKVTVVKGFGD